MCRGRRSRSGESGIIHTYQIQLLLPHSGQKGVNFRSKTEVKGSSERCSEQVALRVSFITYHYTVPITLIVI